jgi:SOS-response transcriptional repressor LexA
VARQPDNPEDDDVVFEAIERHWDTHGYAPIQKDLEATGLTPGRITRAIRRLAAVERIIHLPGKAGGLLLPDRVPPQAGASAAPARLAGAPREALAAATRAYYRRGEPITLGQLASEAHTPSSIIGKHLPGLAAGGWIEWDGFKITPLLNSKREPLPPLPPTQPRPSLAQQSPSAANPLEHALAMARTPDLLHLPILGSAAGGRPIEAVADPDDVRTLTVPHEWARSGSYYALRIVGDSMSAPPASIASGDFVLVRSEVDTEYVRGRVYVCWLPDVGATIKYVETTEEAIELRSSHEDYRPIVAPEGTIMQGRVVKVIRDYE